MPGGAADTYVRHPGADAPGAGRWVWRPLGGQRGASFARSSDLLIDAPQAQVPDVAIVIEEDTSLPAAIAAAAHLRKHAISADLFATGSPRKRFDRAVRKGAREIVVLTVENGRIAARFKSTGEPRAEAVLATLEWPKPS